MSLVSPFFLFKRLSNRLRTRLAAHRGGRGTTCLSVFPESSPFSLAGSLTRPAVRFRGRPSLTAGHRSRSRDFRLERRADRKRIAGRKVAGSVSRCATLAPRIRTNPNAGDRLRESPEHEGTRSSSSVFRSPAGNPADAWTTSVSTGVRCNPSWTNGMFAFKEYLVANEQFRRSNSKISVHRFLSSIVQAFDVQFSFACREVSCTL